MRANLNKLYNPTGSIVTQSLTHSLHSNRHLHNHTFHVYPNATAEHQYFVNIRVDKYVSHPFPITPSTQFQKPAPETNIRLIPPLRSALNRPFYIHFFLGAVPSSEATWSFAPTLIASHSVLFYPPAIVASTSANANTTNSDPTPLTNTANARPPPTPQITTYGQLPLAHALLRFNLSDAAPRSVIPLLAQQLHWRVQDFHDRAVGTVEVDSLKVFVVGREVVSKASGHSFPVYGGWKIYREATEGKVGGLGEGEGM